MIGWHFSLILLITHHLWRFFLLAVTGHLCQVIVSKDAEDSLKTPKGLLVLWLRRVGQLASQLHQWCCSLKKLTILTLSMETPWSWSSSSNSSTSSKNMICSRAFSFSRSIRSVVFVTYRWGVRLKENKWGSSIQTHQDWSKNVTDRLEMNDLYLHVFSYQSPSVVCGVCPVIRLQHLFGVFWIHSEIPKIQRSSLFISFIIVSRVVCRLFWPWLVISLSNFVSPHPSRWRQGSQLSFVWALIILQYCQKSSCSKSSNKYRCFLPSFQLHRIWMQHLLVFISGPGSGLPRHLRAKRFVFNI